MSTNAPKACALCQGTGMTRQDWVRVPLWKPCSCALPSAHEKQLLFGDLWLTWPWIAESNRLRPSDLLTPGAVAPVEVRERDRAIR